MDMIFIGDTNNTKYLYADTYSDLYKKSVYYYK